MLWISVYRRDETHNASFMYANENLSVLSVKSSSRLSGKSISGVLASFFCQYTA